MNVLIVLIFSVKAGYFHASSLNWNETVLQIKILEHLIPQNKMLGQRDHTIEFFELFCVSLITHIADYLTCTIAVLII